MARVSYLGATEAPGDAADVLRSMDERGTEILNLFRALGNSRAALRNFMRLGNSLLRHGALPPVLRELAILRVAQLARADYEWAHHVPIARQAGVRDEQIEGLAGWREGAQFDERERAVLAYAESVASIAVPDEVVEDIRRHLSEEELVELTVVTGYWGMVARVLVALQVGVEPSFTQYLPA